MHAERIGESLCNQQVDVHLGKKCLGKGLINAAESFIYYRILKPRCYRIDLLTKLKTF